LSASLTSARMVSVLAPIITENLLGISTHTSQDIIYFGTLLQAPEAALLALGAGLMVWKWRHALLAGRYRRFAMKSFLLLLLWLSISISAAILLRAPVNAEAAQPGQSVYSNQPLSVAALPDDCAATNKVVPSPNRAPTNEFYAVAAIAPNDVWAVGDYFNNEANNAKQVLIEHWDGTTWSPVSSPNPSPAENSLRAIVALSANDVWAVGYYQSSVGNQMLMLHWDGSAWTWVAGPNLPNTVSFLHGVSATAANDVWAVGYYANVGSSTYQTLTVRWDGAAWSLIPSPRPFTSSTLKAVSAISRTDVWTVGYAIAPGSVPIIFRWNGSQWENMPTNLPSYMSVSLNAVSAISPADVWAVGTYYHENRAYALILHWDGLQWTQVSAPNQPGDNELSGITAVSPNDVWAVGSWGTNFHRAGSEYQPLIMRWDGARWSYVPAPAPDVSAYYGSLRSVHALSAGDAWAVGSYDRGRTLTERWNGRAWAHVPSKDLGMTKNILVSIDVLSANDIWAVGYYEAYIAPNIGIWERTLIQHWDGQKWSIISSPNPAGDNYALTDVAAVSANDVWAVGNTGADGRPYILHWDGARWTRVATPYATGLPNLRGVYAISANDVWAVGSDVPDEGATRTLILHWNGISWRQVPSPNPGSAGNGLAGVVALSANDVWAVGSYRSDGPVRTLTLRWDGARWTHVSSPNVNNAGILQGVDAVSPNSVWAAGYYFAGSATRTLVMRWDGSQWAIVPSPSPFEPRNDLLDITALSDSEVWVVGSTVFPGPESRSAILRWDGATWSQAPTPNGRDVYIAGIEARSPGNIWVVGRYAVGEPFQLRQQSLVGHLDRFSDVSPSDYFNEPVDWLVSRGAISGYNDCTFRPQNNTTRGQLTKIVTLAEGWQLLNPPNHTFTDVAPGSTFYQYIETASFRGIINGYQCGGPGEPCDAQRRPYFRPSSDVTRAQITKIIVQAQGWPLLDPATPSFADVERGTPFYGHIETARARGVIGGYQCGSPEPCDAQRRPYFRPGNSATRGQIAKIVYNALAAP